MAAVDTKRVAGRRTLRFESLDDVVRDAEAIAAAPYRELGNYTFGQICAHLAQTMVYCLDGYPPMPVPWLLRKLGPLMRKRVIAKPPPAGMKMPAKIKAVFTPPPATTEEGLEALRRTVERMKTEPQRHASPLFGRFTREEWDRFHCRHAELHLSFIVPA